MWEVCDLVSLAFDIIQSPLSKWDAHGKEGLLFPLSFKSVQIRHFLGIRRGAEQLVASYISVSALLIDARLCLATQPLYSANKITSEVGVI